MSKLKLDLHKKTDEELGDFAEAHRKAVEKPERFPELSPAREAFDPAAQAFADKLGQIVTAETELQTLRSERDALRVTVESNLNARAGNVEEKSKGDESVMISAGFMLRSAPTIISSLPAPDQVSATMGDAPGEIDVSCHRVARARTYVVEMREHSDTEVPGAWSQVKLSSRSSVTITGLTSGKRYAFRIKAIGPNDLESPWSAETGCMAP
jgi:hypothetical protein